MKILKKILKKEENYNSLQEAFKNSRRINVLFVGLEDIRTDAIIFASFNLENKKKQILYLSQGTPIFIEKDIIKGNKGK